MSKIGLHFIPGPRKDYGEFLRRLAAAGTRPAVIKVVGEFGAAREAKEICGDAVLTVGRMVGYGWEGFDQAAETVPIDEMPNLANRLWHDHYETIIIANPWIDVFEISNEWSAHWFWQAALYVALAPYFEYHQRRIGMFACSTGNPPAEAYPAIALACKDLGPRGHYLTLHQYGGVGTSVETLRGTEPHHALRHRQLYDYLIDHDAFVECIITEAGQSGGAQFVGVEPFIEDYAWYDAELQRDPYILGAAAWTLGQTQGWSSSNIQDALPALADYIIAHPESPPPPLPPPIESVPYIVTANLLPQDTALTEAHHVVEVTHAKRETIVYSADDARRLVKPGLPGSKVKVWAAARWTQGDIVEYLDTAVELLEFPQAPHPPLPPPPAQPALIGVHHRADGGSLRAIDVDAIRQAKLTGYKFYKSTPDDYASIRNLGISLSNCITRLNHPLERHPVGFYVNGSTGIYDVPIQEALAAGVTRFEIFNEPNISEGGLSTMWTTPGEFCSFCALLMDMLKTFYPKAQLFTPALSPQLNTQEWWNAMQTAGLFVRGAGIAAHAYWNSRDSMDSSSDGRHYYGLLPYLSAGKKIWITEASNNQALDSDDEKARQYVDYARTLEPQIAAVYYFCLSSSNVGDGELFNSRRETWVRPGALKDTISVIPGIVGARPR